MNQHNESLHRRAGTPDPKGRSIDAICDRFEEDFRAGRNPEILNYLELADADDRSDLLRELIAVELELRQSTVGGQDSRSGLIAGRYHILRLHAEGNLGRVDVALDMELNREVALKRIRPEHAHEPMFRERFLLEGEVTGRLEHPGIVPVHSLGTDEQGLPYYTMRFIHGVTLRDAIRRFHDGNAESREQEARNLELRDLLRRILVVCDALHHAHSRGVLHRDVKPSNIVLGNDGTTLLVDWGLAKIQGQIGAAVEAGSAEQRLVPSSGSDIAATRTGSIVGTPAYMSPEQAEGQPDALGPRSDVYSLGATLYHVLTGKAPRDGPDGNDQIHLSRLVSFSRPHRGDPRVPAALEAICMKAMAFRPEDRYESARAFAQDLERWLADEPVTALPESILSKLGRWARHHRSAAAAAVLTLMAITTASVAAALLINRARSETLAQRSRAEAGEQLAIDAVAQFRDVVVNDKVLANHEELRPLRKTLLDHPLTFFRTLRDRLHASDDTRPEALYRLALASTNLAITANSIGSRTDSLKLYEDSIPLWERLVQQQHDNQQAANMLAMTHLACGSLCTDLMRHGEAQKHLSLAVKSYELLHREHPQGLKYASPLVACHHELARLYRTSGQPSLAEESERRALMLLDQLDRQNPDDPNVLRLLAGSLEGLGHVRRMDGRLDEAEEFYERALAIRRRQTSMQSPLPDDLFHLATTLVTVHGLLNNTNRHQEALELLREALRVQETVARDNQGVTDYQDLLAKIHLYLGSIEGTLGNRTAYRVGLEKALVIRERMARENPAVPDFQRVLALAQSALGTELETEGRAEESLVLRRNALETRVRLAADFPYLSGVQKDIAESHDWVGSGLEQTGRFVEAIASHRQAIAIREQLLVVNPNDMTLAAELAQSHNTIAHLLQRTGDSAGARISMQAALETAERLARENPAILRAQFCLAETYRSLARLFGEQRQPVLAIEPITKAQVIYERLIGQDPNLLDARRSLLETSIELADFQRQVGHPLDALATLHRVSDWREALLRENSHAPVYREELASVQSRIASLLRGLQRYDEAIQWYNRASEHRQALVREQPDSPDAVSNLAWSLCDIAAVLLDKEEAGPARELLVRAIALRRQALATNPNHPIYTSYGGVELLLLGYAATKLGNPAEAVQALRECVKIGGVPPAPATVRGTATVYALCMPLARTPDERESYAREALTALRASAVADMVNPHEILNEVELAPLHDREDFRSFVAALFDRGFPSDPFAR